MSAMIATLIANPETACLRQDVVDKAARAVKATDLSILAQNIAADLVVEESVNELDIRAVLAGLPVDIIIQPKDGRRKQLLLADMDSTMIGQECIDELAIEVGLGDEIAALTERAMRGELDFASALRQRVRLLKDLPLSVVEEVIATRIHLNEGARQLIATMRHHGAHTALVSGGFTLFTEKIAARVGFDEHYANILCHNGAALTGEVAEPILGGAAKQEKLRELCQKLGLESAQVMAVGDGANDIPMLQEAGSGVAYHAKPRVFEAAKMHINHGDLTALLYIQGYREQDFAL